MKRFKWLLMGLVAAGLVMIPLTGCMGIPQSEYEALQAENAALIDENTGLKAQFQTAQADLTNKQADYDALNTDYEAVSQELAEIKEIYPPRDFSSLSELQDWLLANDVSERPLVEYAEGWYSKALDIQEDAQADGYIVSVDYDYDEVEDSYWVWCATIIDGDIWFWDPETDEPLQEYSLGKVK